MRLIGKWLKAGVMTDAGMETREKGTPQGGVISPILANIFLHHVLDEWMEDVVYCRMSGECRYVRYADDFLILFQKEDDARRVLAVLPKRLGKFGLRLNEGKTKLIRFGRFAKEKEARQNRKPETFDFLGFTHYCGESRNGKFQVMLQTQRKRKGSDSRKLSRELWIGSSQTGVYPGRNNIVTSAWFCVDTINTTVSRETCGE